jgi:hypothetical protein
MQPALEKAGLRHFRFHDLRQNADSPIMPTVAKWLSARFVCGCVPHFADKLNSA